MKTTNGDVVTQFDLHQDEEVGLIKIDLLSIEALDKMRDMLADNDKLKAYVGIPLSRKLKN